MIPAPFYKGCRVKWSAQAHLSDPAYFTRRKGGNEGTVVGGTHDGYGVQVQWDGLKSHEGFHISNLELVK